MQKNLNNLIVDDDELIVYAVNHGGWISALGTSHKIEELFPGYTLKFLTKETFAEKLTNA